MNNSSLLHPSSHVGLVTISACVVGKTACFLFFFQPSGELIKTLETEGKSQESISKVPFMSSDKIASQVDSTGLGWKIISSDSGTEGKFLEFLNYMYTSQAFSTCWIKIGLIEQIRKL